MSNNQNKPKIKQRLFIGRRALATVLTISVLVACIGLSVVFTQLKTWIDERPALDLSYFETMESSRIYDAEGNLVAEVGMKLSDNITYDQLPTSTIDAFLAIEDSRFFEHEGFDVSRFVATAIRNFRSGDFFGGAGASTLTMQTIKNAFFVTEESLAERSVVRKVQEISMSLDVEKQLSKEEIMEHYLNKIGFDVPSSVGISKAAEYYFGKEVSQLTLSESAYLAGVINSPATLNAFKDIEAGTARRNQVLNLMVKHGYISDYENELAQAIRLEDQLVDNKDYKGSTYIYGDYIDAVLNEVTELVGVSPVQVGMDIYTALIPSQQEVLETIQNGEVVGFVDDKVQVALVSLNNNTGEIVALGGGRPDDEDIRRGFNRAIDGEGRQPGSSIKPVLDYALAFEALGWSTEFTIEDGPYAYAGGPFVYNFSRNFSGDVSLTDAVSASLNIPAIKALEAVVQKMGPGYVIDYMKNLGYRELVAENYSLGYAIGSANFLTTPVELAASHGTIINGGVYVKPHTVTRIEIEGQEPVIPEYAQTRAISEQAAYLASYTMQEAVKGRPLGSTSVTMLRNQGYPVYGKTGTTDHDGSNVGIGIPEGAGKDSWIVASTNVYTNVVWYGYDNHSEGDYIRDTVKSSIDITTMMNSVLDGLESVHQPVAIARPGGISNITRIKGVYPYANPVEDMDESLIVKDLVKSDFAILKDYEAPELDALQTQNVTTGRLLLGKLGLDVTMSPYPDADMLEVAKNTKEVSATDKNGVVMKREVSLAFHPSWLFGAVQYGTEVKIDNKVVETVINGDNQRDINVGNVRSNQSIEVCSFYTWEKNHDRRSNEVCQVINSGQSIIKMPSFEGLSFNEFTSWLNGVTNTATVNTETSDARNAAQVGTIARITPDYSRRDSIDQETLDSTTFRVNIYDKTLNGNRIIGRSITDITGEYGSVVTVTGHSNGSDTVSSYVVGGQTITDFSHSFKASQLTKGSDGKFVLNVSVNP